MSNLVSVVIPAYNCSQTIGDTVRSVLAQTHDNLEIIIVNDCSTDNSAETIDEICKSDNRVKLINLTKNFGGPGGPRNVGVRHSQGEWIAFLDSDDIWAPDKLEIQLELILNENKLFICTAMKDFKDTSQLKFSEISATQFKNIDFKTLLFRNQIPTSSVLVSAELVGSNPFNESLSYKAREDYDCWLRCHEQIDSSIKILEPLVGYRISDGQISGSKLKMLQKHAYIMRKYRDKNNKGLGLLAYFYTATHFLASIYQRALMRRL